uniref:Uncharacterized protein n=1 Tax=viral metagenome TaxID=1070528 RepID=A0A2V0RL18_9ZZZZ
MPPKTEEEKFDELKAALFLEFPPLRGSTDAVVRQMLGTKSVKPWYGKYKERVKLEAGLPEGMGAAGLTAEMWDWALDVKKDRSTARAAHAKACEELARKHKLAVDKEDAQLAAALADNDSPLIRLIEAGYEELPLRSQARVAAIEDKKLRIKALDDELLAYRKTMLAQLYPDTTKFTPGDEGTRPVA